MPIILNRAKKLCPKIYIDITERASEGNRSKKSDNLLKTIYVPKYHQSQQKAPVDEIKLDQFVRYI